MFGAKAVWKSERGRTVLLCAAYATVTLVLSAGKIGGLYGVWALAAVAVSGGRGRGFWATVGALLGAYIFYDFHSGLRMAASAVLIYCAKKPVVRVFLQNAAILQKTLEQFRLMHGKRVKFFCDFPFSASPAMLQKQGGKEQRIIRDETGCPYSAVFKSAGGKHSMFIDICSQQIDTAFDKVEVPVDHGIHFRLKIKVPEP